MTPEGCVHWPINVRPQLTIPCIWSSLALGRLLRVTWIDLKPMLIIMENKYYCQPVRIFFYQIRVQNTLGLPVMQWDKVEGSLQSLDVLAVLHLFYRSSILPSFCWLSPCVSDNLLFLHPVLHFFPPFLCGANVYQRKENTSPRVGSLYLEVTWGKDFP